MKESKKYFKKYQHIRNVRKSMSRGTDLTLELYEINETFAYNYLHKDNPRIFTSFLRDVYKVNKVIKAVWDNKWDTLFNEKLYVEGMKHWILNILVVKFGKKVHNRIKFWKMCQKHKDLFKKT